LDDRGRGVWSYCLFGQTYDWRRRCVCASGSCRGTALWKLHEGALKRGRPIPQVLVNVKLPSKLDASQKQRVREISDKYVDLVGSDYRVLIRESGTEPLLRVMVEGPDLQKTKSFADQAATEFKSAVVG